jgi:catechol 2,3-dioxygenase-like lactoylglutathione lyase family enzyme
VVHNVSVRYIVDSVEAALPFYEKLGFEVVMRPAPGFAALKKDNLRLLLNEPGAGGAGQKMGDGREPAPGGWNRFQLPVHDLEATVAELRATGVHFRNEIVVGRGGKQILAEDPAGNLVELFEQVER